MRGEARGLNGLVDVEFAGAAVIVHAVGEVAVLLGFKQYGAGPDGMDGAGIHEDHVAFVNRQDVEALFESAIVNAIPDLIHGDAGLETCGDLRPGFGRQRVPALGLSAGLAIFLCQTVVGVNLDAELFAGKDDLDEQR